MESRKGSGPNQDPDQKKKKTQIDNDVVSCPYDKKHRIVKSRLLWHIQKCKAGEKIKNMFAHCKYNYLHILEKVMLSSHEFNCVDKPKEVERKDDFGDQAIEELAFKKWKRIQNAEKRRRAPKPEVNMPEPTYDEYVIWQKSKQQLNESMNSQNTSNQSLQSSMQKDQTFNESQFGDQSCSMMTNLNNTSTQTNKTVDQKWLEKNERSNVKSTRKGSDEDSGVSINSSDEIDSSDCEDEKEKEKENEKEKEKENEKSKVSSSKERIELNKKNSYYSDISDDSDSEDDTENDQSQVNELQMSYMQPKQQDKVEVSSDSSQSDSEKEDSILQPIQIQDISYVNIKPKDSKKKESSDDSSVDSGEDGNQEHVFVFAPKQNRCVEVENSLDVSNQISEQHDLNQSKIDTWNEVNNRQMNKKDNNQAPVKRSTNYESMNQNNNSMNNKSNDQTKQKNKVEEQERVQPRVYTKKHVQLHNLTQEQREKYEKNALELNQDCVNALIVVSNRGVRLSDEAHQKVMKCLENDEKKPNDRSSRNNNPNRNHRNEKKN